MKELAKDVHHLVRLGVRLNDSNEDDIFIHNGLASSLVVDVKENQHMNLHLSESKKFVVKNKIGFFS